MSLSSPVPPRTRPTRSAVAAARRGYRAFGLAVASEMPLVGFREVPLPEAPDVLVDCLPVDPAGLVAYNDDGDHVATAPPGLLKALVEKGRRVTVDVDPAADPEFVSAVVTGELFSVVLRQRGLLVLHGSAVAKDGCAVGFIGHSGWGKSTLAAGLVGRGWQLLTDDVLVVAGLPGADEPAGDARPTALPAHPMMRLAAESAARVGHGGTHEAAHSRTTKLRVDWDAAFLDEPVRLAHVFVLDPRGFEAAEAPPLPRHLAALEMAHHTRGRKLLVSEAYRRAHLAQCGALARHVPVSALRRQFGLEHLDALCALVEATAAARQP